MLHDVYIVLFHVLPKCVLVLHVINSLCPNVFASKEGRAVARLSFSVAEGAAWSPSSAVMVILTALMALTSLCVPVSKRACHCV